MIDRLKKYIEKNEIYQDYKNGKLTNASDFDHFCIQHCNDIEELLKMNAEANDIIEKLINYAYESNMGTIEFEHFCDIAGKDVRVE